MIYEFKYSNKLRSSDTFIIRKNGSYKNSRELHGNDFYFPSLSIKNLVSNFNIMIALYFRIFSESFVSFNYKHWLTENLENLGIKIYLFIIL